MAIVARWIIEENRGSPSEPSWDTAGSVVGPRNREAAIQKGRETIPRIESTSQLRAITWDEATEEQQEAAAYEDDIMGRAFGGALGRTPLPGEPSAWENDFARGNLPMWANTPAKGCLYASMGFVWSWAIVIAVVVAVVVGLRACTR